MALRLTFAAAALALIASAPAWAQSPCKGAAPVAGQVLQGAVLHVVDGRHICLATSPSPDAWTEIELATPAASLSLSSDPALSKASLMRAAFAKQARCTIAARSDGHLVADCRIEGAPLESLLAEPGALEKAAAWLPAPAAPISLADNR